MAIGIVWALWVLFLGDVDLYVFDLHVHSREPLRAVALAVAGAALLLVTDGFRATLERVRTAATDPDDRKIAATLAVATLLIGVAYSSTAAAGADAYGYVSQADLWISGRLKTAQPWVADVPWPNAEWSFSPLGYRPADNRVVGTIVPTYSPGLPLMMAGAKRLAGQCAMFWIVPVFGALLVLATFGIGQRLHSARVGSIAAFLVATSPVVLYQLVVPLTDVPVAGAWAVSFYCLLGSTSLSALAAGIFAALAILIRPNLVPLAAVMGLLYLIRFARQPSLRAPAFRQGLLFALATASGVAVVALVNQHLFGSPFTSGYGRLQDQFAWARLWPNFVHYLTWLTESHTPLALVGLIAVFVPIRMLWPKGDRTLLTIVALFVATLWVIYCAYLEFDVWWYLRFLLPSWPFIMIGASAGLLSLSRADGPAVRVAVAAAILAVGAINVRTAARESAFDMWRGERRYPSLARYVRESTPENSAIFSMQHSGTVRYYGGRITIRYDEIEPSWIDRAVRWLSARGVQSYLLAEDWEVDRFRERFAGTETLKALDAPPVFIYEGGGQAELFDLSAMGGPPARHGRIHETFRELRCMEPAEPPRLVLR
jgi:hypothetical protein